MADKMIINENFVKNILLEEYEKRLVLFLCERIQLEDERGINVWKNADQIKIRHEETGLEFTFGGFVGNDSVKLYLPDESRFEEEVNSYKKIYEFAKFGEEYEEPYNKSYSEKENNKLYNDDINKSKNYRKNKKRKYVIIPKKLFIDDFIL